MNLEKLYQNEKSTDSISESGGREDGGSPNKRPKMDSSDESSQPAVQVRNVIQRTQQAKVSQTINLVD